MLQLGGKKSQFFEKQRFHACCKGESPNPGKKKHQAVLSSIPPDVTRCRITSISRHTSPCPESPQSGWMEPPRRQLGTGVSDYGMVLRFTSSVVRRFGVWDRQNTRYENVHVR
eukprot:1338154-Amorphochlora_amoeboformis.AAC.1